MLRISPPMNIGRSDVDEFIKALDESLAVVGAVAAGSSTMTTASLPEHNLRAFPELASGASPRKKHWSKPIAASTAIDAPCTAACPTHIDVPRFIKKIATGNLRGSALTILDANILGLSCSRVCPVDVLCEGACVMHRYNQKPIEIGRLQRHAMEHYYAKLQINPGSPGSPGSAGGLAAGSFPLSPTSTLSKSPKSPASAPVPPR